MVKSNLKLETENKENFSLKCTLGNLSTTDTLGTFKNNFL